MTVAQQSQSLSDSIQNLRTTLDDIENALSDDDPLLAMQLAELIGDSADSILWAATALARRVPGASWTVIGGRLGITRQAAHQRLGAVDS
jgi:hypothetical protein